MLIRSYLADHKLRVAHCTNKPVRTTFGQVDAHHVTLALCLSRSVESPHARVGRWWKELEWPGSGGWTLNRLCGTNTVTWDAVLSSANDKTCFWHARSLFWALSDAVLYRNL